jgi:hypothetical protein
MMREEVVMFVALMEMIEKNSGRLAAGIMKSIKRNGEAGHGGADGAGEDAPRESAIYEDLLKWLFDNLREGNLVAYYSSLGERTHLRGASLEEIVKAILVVQKEIMAIVIDEIGGQGVLPLNEMLDLVFRVNLFFDLVMHSVVSGYHREPAQVMFDSPGEQAGKAPVLPR